MATDGFQLPRRVSIRARFEPVRNVVLSAATMGSSPNPPSPGELRTFGSRKLAKIVPPKEMKKVLPLVSFCSEVQISAFTRLLLSKRYLEEGLREWKESLWILFLILTPLQWGHLSWNEWTFMNKKNMLTWRRAFYLLRQAIMFFCALFNFTILRNTKDVLVVTAPGSGAEVMHFTGCTNEIACLRGIFKFSSYTRG